MQRTWGLVMLAFVACDDGGSTGDVIDATPPDARVRDAQADATPSADAATPDAATPDAATPMPDAALMPDAAPDAGPDPGRCVEGETRQSDGCGLNRRGVFVETCEMGDWVAGPCDDPDVCIDDERGPCPDGPGTRACRGGQWQPCDGSLCPPRLMLAIDEPWRGVIPDAGEWQGSCGGEGGEAVALFVAPDDGRYAFDAGGSAFDTVLYLRSSCARDDTEIACNDDGNDLQSYLEADLRGGQGVAVFIDGFDGGGDFEVVVRAVEPPDCEAGSEEIRRCEAPGAIPAEQRRFCAGGEWRDWSPCEQTGECVPDTVEVQACRADAGPGESRRACDGDGQWSDWSACEPTGGCFAYAYEWEACDAPGTQRFRQCSAAMEWGEWSACFGDACPAQAVAEHGTQLRWIPPGESRLRADCGDGLGPLSTQRYTAPVDGTYAFWLQTAAPMLSIRTDCEDGASSLMCNTYNRVPFEYRPVHAQGTLALEADDEITIITGTEAAQPVQGQAYSLNIDHRPAAGCVEEPVDNHTWASALPSDATDAAFGSSLGLLSADQCADQPDWFATTVPMGCNLVFAPLRTLHGGSSVRIRRPDGVVAGDSGLLGPFSRVINAQRPGTWRLQIDPAPGDEPQTLVSMGWVCGNRTFHCGRGDDSAANDDPERPQQLAANMAISEPICGADVDHLEFVPEPGCHTRLTVACDLETYADLDVEFTDGEDTPLPMGAIQPEPGLGPMMTGVVIDRAPDTGPIRVRMQSMAADSDGRCDLRVDSFCLADVDCDADPIGRQLGDYGAFGGALCDQPKRYPTQDVPAGCALEARIVDAAVPVQLSVRTAAGAVVAEGVDAVRHEVAETGAYDLYVGGQRDATYVLDAAVRCD